MILIKHPKNWGLTEKAVFQAAKLALKNEGYAADEVELSIYLVGRLKAKKLNQVYRQMNYVPQVLAFPMSRAIDSDGLRHLGDIVICTSKLKYEARFLKKKINTVLEAWMRHGVENLV